MLVGKSKVMRCSRYGNEDRMHVKGKVFYGQEPPSGESTTTDCLFNYQLLAQ